MGPGNWYDADPQEIIPQSSVVDFSVDGKWLVTSSIAEHRFWHVGTWMPGPTIRKLRELSGTFACDKDGTLLAIQPTSRSIQLIHPETFREVATFESPNGRPLCCAAFSPDGRRLCAMAADGEILVWDLGAIRQRLGELGLDWDAPTLPAGIPAKPIAIMIDPGK